MHLIQLIRFLGNGLSLPALPLVLLALPGCDAPAPEATTTAACDPGGFLRVELYGALRTRIEWLPGDLACEGMPRPDGQGARLRLSGPVEEDASDAESVAIILGIPDLIRGETGSELPVNVTVVLEGSGRFFSTRDTADCWADITHHAPLAGEGAADYRIGGAVYCVSPLAELNGGSGISFTELSFAGRLNWDIPE